MYQIYKPLLSSMSTKLRKQMKIPKKEAARNKNRMLSLCMNFAVHSTITQTELYGAYMDTLPVSVLELTWIKSGADTVFIDSVKLCDFIMKSKCNLRNRFPINGVYAISPPKGLMVDGEQVPAFLVAKFNVNQMDDFLKPCGELITPDVRHEMSLIEDLGNTNKKNKGDVFYLILDDGYHSSTCCASDKVDRHLGGLLPESRVYECEKGVFISSKDDVRRPMLDYCIELAVKSFFYREAFPQSFVKSIPDKRFVANQFGVKGNVSLLKSCEIVDQEISPHYRVGHWRSGHYRELSSGKVVWVKGHEVKPCLVNADVKNPETAIK